MTPDYVRGFEDAQAIAAIELERWGKTGIARRIRALQPSPQNTRVAIASSPHGDTARAALVARVQAVVEKWDKFVWPSPAAFATWDVVKADLTAALKEDK